MTRRQFLILSPWFAVCLAGCQLPWFRRQPVESFPVVFTAPATKEQVIGAVNANTARIHQLQSDVTISVQGLPGLRGNLALEQPRRLRMRAGLLGIPGTGVDLGSNDDLFWVWFERNQPPGVYFARHEAFAHSPARQMIPIEPNWLIDALGVVQLDPGGVHEGPYQDVPGKIQLRSRIPSAKGDVLKITVVHERYGWVLEQYMYDGRGQLIASARASQHRYYPREGVSLPQHVEVDLAPGQSTQISFRIDIGTYQINRLTGNPQQLWSMPRPDGFPLIDIADPRFGDFTQSPPAFAPDQSVGFEPNPRASFRPRYRQANR